MTKTREAFEDLGYSWPDNGYWFDELISDIENATGSRSNLEFLVNAVCIYAGASLGLRDHDVKQVLESAVESWENLSHKKRKKI